MLLERVLILLIITGLIMICYYIWKTYQKDPNEVVYQDLNSPKQYATQLKNLWQSQVYFMREYMIRAVYKLSRQQELEIRVMSNMMDILNVLNHMYPNSVNDLKMLFTKHINLFFSVTTSIITFDGENYEEFAYAWDRNARLIAKEISTLNPAYINSEFTMLIINYLRATELEIRANLAQESALDQYDKVSECANRMADYLILAS